MAKIERTKPAKPKIYPRSSWHARPTQGGLSYGKDLAATYYRATCHHDAANAPPGMSLQEALSTVKSHQEQHMGGSGWSDIGYHYLIAPSGDIIEGRPLAIQGAHVEHENGGNVGICLMGQLHLHEPTARQIQSLKALYSWLCWDLDLDSNCLKGHKDYLPTLCPGSLYGKIPEVRAAAKKALTTTGEKEKIEPVQVATPNLTLNGKPLGDLLIVDGVSYAPVRVLAAGLGLETRWDPTTKTVSLERS